MRLKLEKMVERGHAGNLGRGHAEELRDGVELLRAEKAHVLLHPVQDGDELTGRLGAPRGRSG